MPATATLTSPPPPPPWIDARDGASAKANNKKTGEVVHYRLVEESDVEAIKKKLKLDF